MPTYDDFYTYCWMMLVVDHGWPWQDAQAAAHEYARRMTAPPARQRKGGRVMNHPQTYLLTREEWLAVNRALASGNLANNNVMNRDRNERQQIIREAEDIMMAVYDRAKSNNRLDAAWADIARTMAAINTHCDSIERSLEQTRADAIEALQAEVARLTIALKQIGRWVLVKNAETTLRQIQAFAKQRSGELKR